MRHHEEVHIIKIDDFFSPVITVAINTGNSLERGPGAVGRNTWGGDPVGAVAERGRCTPRIAAMPLGRAVRDGDPSAAQPAAAEQAEHFALSPDGSSCHTDAG